MSRLIFVYVSDGSAVDKSQVPYDPSLTARNHFAVNEAGLVSDGYSYLLKDLKKSGIFEDVVIFIESARGPGQFSYPNYNLNGYVVPHIDYINDYLKPGDILWIRGGWKHWHNWLASLKGKHWLSVYAANTGRDKWKFWDVILDDFNSYPYVDVAGRFHFNFIKPVNEDIFKPLPASRYPVEWDVCIGLSHIHEKKGQLRAVEAIADYYQKYGPIKCVLPGRFVKSSYKHNLLYLAESKGLKIDLVGMLPRKELVEVVNQSRIAIFCSVGGQNDRGPIECMACGTPFILNSTKRHHSLVYKDKIVSTVIGDGKSSLAVADIIHSKLSECINTEYIKKHVTAYYQDHQSSFVIVPRMLQLFKRMAETKPGSNEALCGWVRQNIR